MAIRISDERKAQLISEIVTLYHSEFDEKISPFRAEQLLDLFLQKLGPGVYNQGVQDARAYVQARLEDLEGEVYASDAF
jgi:uncharacterized protein (DUF2164 family)